MEFDFIEKIISKISMVIKFESVNENEILNILTSLSGID